VSRDEGPNQNITGELEAGVKTVIPARAGMTEKFASGR
jgi:hypothetical protein